MGARFIKKNDGNMFLRIDGGTNQVQFAAASSASNIYNLYIYGLCTISKPYSDADIGGGGQTSNFPYSVFDVYDERYMINNDPNSPLVSSVFNVTSGTDYYIEGASNTGRYYTIQQGGSVSNPGILALGGEFLSELTTPIAAFPGSGTGIQPKYVKIKTGGNWKNAFGYYVKYNGEWKEVRNAYIKSGGSWRQYHLSNENSQYINLIEGTDDAIDFCVYVYALN